MKKTKKLHLHRETIINLHDAHGADPDEPVVGTLVISPDAPSGMISCNHTCWCPR